MVLTGSRSRTDSLLRKPEAGNTSARANAHITREQLVWIASRLAVKPMMNSTNSGLVTSEPSWKAIVSATGSTTSPEMTAPKSGMARISASDA